MMFARDSLIHDQVAAEMGAIFKSHLFACHHTGQDKARINRSFHAPDDGLGAMPAKSKTLMSVSILLLVLIVSAEVGSYFATSTPPAHIGPSVARHDGEKARNPSKIIVTDITADWRSPHAPAERDFAKPTLTPASLFGASAKPGSMSDKARQASAAGQRRVAGLTQYEANVRQPERQLRATAGFARSDRNCASWPDGSTDSQICWHDKLMWAHDRLVTSYNDAVHAGVPRGQLLRYRNEWLSARRTSRVDPAGTIRDYGKLSGGLQEAARMAQSVSDEDNYEAGDDPND